MKQKVQFIPFLTLLCTVRLCAAVYGGAGLLPIGHRHRFERLGRDLWTVGRHKNRL